MLLSLIIPVYNEAGHLNKFLQELDSFDFGTPVEFVFVNDCSKDESLTIMNSFSFKNKSQIIDLKINQGKGNAIRVGIEKASGTVIAVQDADFEYSLDDLKVLIQPILNNKADIVFGSRFRKNGVQVHRTFHYFINRFLTVFSNLCSGLYLTDMETCYKVFRAEIIQNINLQSNRFGFEPEVTAKIARLKARIEEYPIKYFPRTYMEGKKISWKDGVAALWHIAYFNLFIDKTRFFKKQMPPHFIPRGSQWL